MNDRDFSHIYEGLISLENLFLCWEEFRRGKRKKLDVMRFEINLEDNIFFLHEELKDETYYHRPYTTFHIWDPKHRVISKADVRDRLVHHAVYRILYPFFDQTFIYDSYSCRIDKGTHRAIRKFQTMFLEVSNCNRKTCRVLKCDIKKFFASIDHEVLKQILSSYILDENILGLLGNIIGSFTSADKLNDREVYKQQGLPLGNLTSQLFVNIYMNQFDQFIKHKLKAKHYIRYADDFMILSQDRQELINQLTTIQRFLQEELKLSCIQTKLSSKPLLPALISWAGCIFRITESYALLQKTNAEKNYSTFIE